MSKFTCLVLCFAAVTLSSVYAISEEEKANFREIITPIITECSQKFGVSKDDIKSAKEVGSADGIDSCFLGCVFKKAEILNDKGLYDVETGLTKLKQYVKGADDLAKFEEIGKKCASVNEQSVSDGEAGCERAKLLLSCFLENKAQIPL